MTNAGPSSVSRAALVEVNVVCRDLEAALGFHRDALGLPAGWAVADPDGNPIEVIARVA